jgi:hypothetical protein
MRAITDRHRLTYLRFSAATRSSSLLHSGFGARPAFARASTPTYPQLPAEMQALLISPDQRAALAWCGAKDLSQHSSNHGVRGFGAMTESVSSLFSMPSRVSIPPSPREFPRWGSFEPCSPASSFLRRVHSNPRFQACLPIHFECNAVSNACTYKA